MQPPLAGGSHEKVTHLRDRWEEILDHLPAPMDQNTLRGSLLEQMSKSKVFGSEVKTYYREGDTKTGRCSMRSTDQLQSLKRLQWGLHNMRWCKGSSVIVDGRASYSRERAVAPERGWPRG